MNAIFDSFRWHDAELKELLVDRREPGTRDVVQLLVAWPHGGESMFMFHDCYAMTANMHFGIVATERIGNASLITDDQYLFSIRELWRPLSVSLEDLRCYRFEMSSTGSDIRVYAQRFEVVSIGNQGHTPPDEANGNLSQR
jgi:hypothetical protein